MTSFIKKSEIKNDWLLIDAENAVVGRLAAYISTVLRGKNKSQYTPHMDNGDFVIVTNIEKIKFTGNKFKDKKYYKHTGYPGGIKSTTPSILISKKPEEILKLAVKRMLPDGPLAKKQLSKLKIIDNFYKKFLNKKPNFAILGLNPHNFSISKKSEEKKIINKAIKSLVKLKINAKGPVAPDSSFVIFKKYKFDVIIGMYHDQVLSPFKALYNFFAINITLGLPYIRISPDHGIAEDIVGKKIANPNSLIESIKFFNYIK